MKKESSFKMKGFSGFGNSPVKQKQQAKAKNVRNIYSAAGKVDMTLNDKLNQAVRGKSATFATPKIEAQKATGTVGRKVKLGPLKPGPLGGSMTAKGKEINYKNFSNKMSYKADQARKMKDILNKKPTSFGRRIFRNFKNVAKGFGRIAGKRATGIAGMMMGTMGTADAFTPPGLKGKMNMQQEHDLVTRIRRKKK